MYPPTTEDGRNATTQKDLANEIGIRQGNNQHTTNGLTQHKKNWHRKSNATMSSLKNNSIDGQNFVPQGKTDTIVALWQNCQTPLLILVLNLLN